MHNGPQETRIVITSWQGMRLGAGLLLGVALAPVVLAVELAGWMIATRRNRPHQ